MKCITNSSIFYGGFALHAKNLLLAQIHMHEFALFGTNIRKFRMESIFVSGVYLRQQHSPLAFSLRAPEIFCAFYSKWDKVEWRLWGIKNYKRLQRHLLLYDVGWVATENASPTTGTWRTNVDGAEMANPKHSTISGVLIWCFFVCDNHIFTLSCYILLDYSRRNESM